ncbi:MAG TPA: homoserine O-succinyltransferase [Candidatus Coproplasma avicola]|uniref:Homoserine O-acetyltransferase n=1 Tax=Candidatus Coproplasma avicola TaxID=2840744 RepID=A0A9D1J9E0_9FIRM|nr:homoserine O-succinyltransferase [Candidatus Coproplasma avicola]
MPIVIDKDIPAFKILTGERIFVMDTDRAFSQEIRPIEIAILNLMPTKETTETQFMRLLSNSPLQVNITLVRTATYNPTHTEQEHLKRFYKSFAEIKTRKFDGMIITGAPVENMPFEQVAYWRELEEILDWTATNVTSTLFICWGAQAALHYFYGIKKHPLKEKCFGIFAHQRVFDGEQEPLMRGISDEFHMPHSRHTIIYAEDIKNVPDLKILAFSRRAGASIIKSRDNKRVFVTGHMEYDRDTLKKEYERDKAKGLDIKPPVNYFADKEMTKVKMNWSSTANLFYINWLNYYVYQVTPYKLD